MVLNNSQFFTTLEKNIKNHEMYENKMLKRQKFQKNKLNKMVTFNFVETIK